ncbi:hypothetical protein BU23DRAFT_663822 [Bimuria novae-zelandiae CBS 107.79]|uniref:Uncharacterized protein n=1 Tax=Bimuria novae-zelandiae CBS 107.79 TaxID=1447943 RepID=A0A6A5UMM1_9PLEO|nr:hypothetical protein BU23DRAFT_663822 [Bimuria novae-zelandiae CBS 107.79]
MADPYMPDLPYFGSGRGGHSRGHGYSHGHGHGAAVADIYNKINQLAQQINRVTRDINTHLTRLEAPDWNQRARSRNLGRPKHDTRLVPLAHHLANTAIEGFPQNDDECSNLSDLEVQRILHSLGHAGHDVQARRTLLENVIEIKD